MKEETESDLNVCPRMDAILAVIYIYCKGLQEAKKQRSGNFILIQFLICLQFYPFIIW